MLKAVYPPGVDRPLLACREIVDGDLPAVAALLAEGFPGRTVEYWCQGLHRLALREPTAGTARFGHVLTADGMPVGVLLVIHSAVRGKEGVFGNVSGWYVRAAFRPLAAILHQRALRNRAVTYVNLSAAQHTWPVIEALGFRRITSGVFLGVGLPRRRWPVSAVVHDAATEPAPPGIARLLEDHIAFGCIALWVETAEGCVPFIFRRRILSRVRLPCALLVFCPSLELVERFAAPLSRALRARGLPFLLAPGPRALRGFLGLYFADKMPVYIKGDSQPAIGDRSYTEFAVFDM